MPWHVPPRWSPREQRHDRRRFGGGSGHRDPPLRLLRRVGGHELQRPAVLGGDHPRAVQPQRPQHALRGAVDRDRAAVRKQLCLVRNARRVGRPSGGHGTAATPRDGTPPLSSGSRGQAGWPPYRSPHRADVCVLNFDVVPGTARAARWRGLRSSSTSPLPTPTPPWATRRNGTTPRRALRRRPARPTSSATPSRRLTARSATSLAPSTPRGWGKTR